MHIWAFMSANRTPPLSLPPSIATAPLPFTRWHFRSQENPRAIKEVAAVAEEVVYSKLTL